MRYLYVIGGEERGAHVDTIEAARIHEDGSLGSFQRVNGVALAVARSRHAMRKIGERVVVIGGLNAGGPVASVEHAAIE